MDEISKWYVIHTYSGYEKMVAENIKKAIETKNLKDVIQEAKVPIQKIKELRNGEYKNIERKLFPGYVLVKMVLNDDSWFIIKHIKGVTGFVGDPYNPNSLSQIEVERLGIEEKNIKVDYKVGDVVEVVSGALKGFIGNVEEVDEENSKVKVNVSVFGRNTSIDVDLDKVVLKRWFILKLI